MFEFAYTAFSVPNIMLPALEFTTLEYTTHAGAVVSPRPLPRLVRSVIGDCVQSTVLRIGIARHEPPWRRIEPLASFECSAAMVSLPREIVAT